MRPFVYPEGHPPRQWSTSKPSSQTICSTWTVPNELTTSGWEQSTRLQSLQLNIFCCLSESPNLKFRIWTRMFSGGPQLCYRWQSEKGKALHCKYGLWWSRCEKLIIFLIRILSPTMRSVLTSTILSSRNEGRRPSHQRLLGNENPAESERKVCSFWTC